MAKTYGFNGIKLSGPRKMIPIQQRMDPIIINNLGLIPRSHRAPQNGVDNAYVRPVVMKINPVKNGLRLEK